MPAWCAVDGHQRHSKGARNPVILPRASFYILPSSTYFLFYPSIFVLLRADQASHFTQTTNAFLIFFASRRLIAFFQSYAILTEYRKD